MNLNNQDENELIQGLKDILAQKDDKAGNHCVWVDTGGGVHIDQLPEGVGASEWEKIVSGFKFRKDTTLRGNGYVGKEAANDIPYVQDLLSKLRRDWKNNENGHIDW